MIQSRKRGSKINAKDSVLSRVRSAVNADGIARGGFVPSYAYAA